MSCKEGALNAEKKGGDNTEDRTNLVGLAEQVYHKVKPYVGTHGLEVEVRLCSHQVPTPELQRPFTILPEQRGPRQGKIIVGVSKGGFEAIKTYLLETKTSTEHPPLQSTTKDVIFKRERYTYNIEGSGAERIWKLAAVLIKKRLLIMDVAVNQKGVHYDFRLSVNSESGTSIPATSPPMNKMQTYARFKERTSIEDGLFRYDLTEVRALDGNVSYEVEIEGCFKDKDTKEELTEKWLLELMQRVLKLAEIASK